MNRQSRCFCVLAIREQQLGAEHPDTATSLHGLALLRQMQGNYFQARGLIERALKIRAKALGCEHPKTRQARAYLDEHLSVIEKVDQTD